MKRMLSIALALSFGSTVQAAAQGLPTTSRDELRRQIDAVLGDSRAIAPMIDDASQRIGDAVHLVARNDPPPAQILDLSQKIAFVRALQAGGEPDLALRPEQEAKLRTYASDVARLVVPIVAGDGAKIDATLTPVQRAKLLMLRESAVERFSSRAGKLADLGLDPGGFVADPELATAGAFVLACEIDPKVFRAR